MKHLKILIWLIVGGVIGGLFGFGFAIGLGLLAKWSSPEDPTAFSVATIGIFTFPMGILFGGAIGGLVATWYYDRKDDG